MVLIVITLFILVLLLACYGLNNHKQFTVIYIKQFLKSRDDDKYNLTLTSSSSPSPTSVTTLTDECYHATEIRPLKTIWDIPGPPRIPLMGTKWMYVLYFYKYTLNKLHEVNADLHRKYGDIVLEVTPSNIPIVHLFNKADLDKVLKYPSKYPYRPITEIIVVYRKSRPDRYCSAGLVNEQGEVWHKLRTSLTHQITSPRVLQNFLPALNSICDDFIELLRAKRNPQTLVVTDFEDIANLMGLEAVCTLMLGRRMGFLDINTEQPEKIKQLATAVKQLFLAQRDSYYGWGLWKYFKSKMYNDFVRAEDLIYDVISEIIEQSLEEIKKAAECEDDEATGLRCIFLSILAVKDLDIKDKKSAIIDFIAAGIETLANTLLFVLSSVTSDAQYLPRILEEFSEYRDTNILQDALTHATYTKACIQESYRLRPTAFCVARVLEEDMELSGYTLKSGTFVLCQSMVACHDERNFKDATSFHPERWIDQQGNFTVNIENAGIVVPFGVGRRTCPGKRFVEMEVVMLLAKLVLAFDISFVQPLETEFEFLLAPKKPQNLILRDRIY